MPNMAATISSHNHHCLRVAHADTQPNQQQKTCNCRDRTKCPLNGQCLQKSVIYQATVTTEDDSQTQTYIGLTEQTFKSRYNSHSTSFNNLKYKNATELSKHVWELKSRNINYNIKWRIIKKAAAYNPSSKKCQLCLSEKFYIICRPHWCTLNKRNELASSCRHRNKYLLANYKSKQKD
jgi:hypothetical protein